MEPCAWNPSMAAATRTQNRLQNGVQAFYLVSRFHDHLETAPIGFTSAWGNFEKADGDAVEAQTDRTAPATADGPGRDHLNNANMSTPPDGQPPRMQMYLFRDGNSGLRLRATSTAATTPASSGTSTAHGLPAGW